MVKTVLLVPLIAFIRLGIAADPTPPAGHEWQVMIVDESGKEQISLAASPHDTIKQLIQSYQEMSSLGVRDIVLAYHNHELTEGSTLLAAGLTDGCSICATKAMQVFIKTFGSTITIWVAPVATVDELLDKVAEREGKSKNTMRLIYSGRQLEPTKALAAYDIKDTATIHLAARLCGD